MSTQVRRRTLHVVRTLPLTALKKALILDPLNKWSLAMTLVTPTTFSGRSLEREGKLASRPRTMGWIMKNCYKQSITSSFSRERKKFCRKGSRWIIGDSHWGRRGSLKGNSFRKWKKADQSRNLFQPPEMSYMSVIFPFAHSLLPNIHNLAAWFWYVVGAQLTFSS